MLIEYYDKFEIKKQRPKDSYEKAFFWIYKANFSEDEVMTCEVCFQPISRRWNHVMNVHHDLLVSTFDKAKRHKGFLQNTILRDGICPIGCGYKSTYHDIRLHLIYFYSKI